MCLKIPESYNIREVYYPAAPSSAAVLSVSCSGDPPTWILKKCGIEASGQRQYSKIAKLIGEDLISIFFGFLYI